MKVTLPEDYKDIFTINDIKRARAIIADQKNDNSTAKEWAEYAAREILKNSVDSVKEVISASAETAKNYRIWNRYGTEEDSQDMDVWVSFLARTYYGFIEGGAYLTDIWETGATDYTEHMYIVKYQKVSL